jgi:hypothetical protein
MLRAIRELASAEPLRVLERQLDNSGFDFISYRLAEGARDAFEKVSLIVGKKGAVFWDRWSLPRRLTERRDKLDLEPSELDKLDKHIQNQINLARKFWIIRSPSYGAAGTYSEREFSWARKQGKFVACFSNR